MAEKPKNTTLGTLAAGVAQTLEAQIRSGVLPVGKPLPSERALVTDFGVSRGVVRAALEYLASIGLLDHRPRFRPVVLSTQPKDRSHLDTVGVWMWPSAGHFSGSQILKGLQQSLGSSIQLVVGASPDGPWKTIVEAERVFLENMAAHPATMGIVSWYLGGHRNLQALESIRERGIPIAFVDRMPPVSFEVDFVGTNNVDSARTAVQHLIELGHRRIVMVTNRDSVTAVQEREEGFRLALTNAPIEFHPDLLYRVQPDEPEMTGTTVDAILARPEPVTAIFCVNDHLALSVCDLLTRKGIRIPQDISIVGFDHILRWVPGPSYLTTMRQDFERMGQLAGSILLDRVRGGGSPAARHMLLDAPLVQGSSTAPPRPDRPLPEDHPSRPARSHWTEGPTEEELRFYSPNAKMR